MELRRYKNLAPDTSLHRHLERLLRTAGGHAPAAHVCEEVLKIPSTDTGLTHMLLETLIADDPRVRLNGNGLVEWVEPSSAELWASARRFVALDVESANGGRGDQRILELGLTVIEQGRITREWSALLNPERPIHPYVRRLTGITAAQARGAPLFAELASRVLDELEDAILVGHHARFDVSCLNSEVSRLLGKRLTNRYLCTVELARHFLPGSRNYRLETLSEWLGLKHERPHRAGSDARATAELFCHLQRSTEAPWDNFLRPRPPAEGADEASDEKGETNRTPVA